MPTVLRIAGFRFFFFSLENDEPSHIHVEHGEKIAKYWLDPVAVAMNDGFRPHELTKVRALVMQHKRTLQEAWNAHLGDKT
jgi:hypothetical protein